MNWTQEGVKHTSNGSKATQTTLETLGQMKRQVKRHIENADRIELKVHKEYKLQGARIAIMTQKLAYDWITQLKELKPITRKGQENLKDTMDALEESGSPRPTEQKLERPKILQNKKEHWRLVLEANPQ